MNPNIFKPHLKKIDGYWYCAASGQIGMGWTALQAYDEWLSAALEAA